MQEMQSSVDASKTTNSSSVPEVPHSVLEQKAIAVLPKVDCKRCGHTWKPIVPKPPVCPKCFRKIWDRIPLTPEEKFWSHVHKTESCWIWTGALSKSGYGKFQYKRTEGRAHRVSWVLHHGKIPDGLLVLHDCPNGDNRACVNPDHLWLGTNADNSGDMVQKGRSLKGENNPQSKLTEVKVLEIRKLYSRGLTLLRLSEMFGVDRTIIHDVVRFKRWTHV